MISTRGTLLLMENLLNERQTQVLKAIVEEYIETATEVGSETLDKKYSLGVSPATIRNAMVFLTKQGFLRQSHVSSGRVPTPKALKFYIKDLMKSKDLSVADEVAAKEKVWDFRSDFDKLLRETTHALADKTKTLALSTDEMGDLYYSGAANILEMPEFYDIDLTKSVLSLLDSFDFWEDLIGKDLEEDDSVHFLLGEDLGKKYLDACGFVYIRYQLPKHKGILGIVGPYRLDYVNIVPTLKYFHNLMEEIGGNW